MKTPSVQSPSVRVRRSRWVGAGLAAFLAAACSVHAQFTLVSAYVNVYFNDGNGVVYDTKNGVGGPFSGGPLVGGAANGVALVNPLGPSFGGISISSPYSFSSAVSSPSLSAVALASYTPAEPLYGSNVLNPVSLNPLGSSLTLNNNGTHIAEIRLDWTASYTVTAGCDLSTLCMLDFSGNVSTPSDFAAAASSITYVKNTDPPVTATSAAGGTYTGYPPVLDPAGQFWDYGTGFTGYYHSDPYGVGSPNILNLSSGDTLTVTGFIDLFVDPGTAVVNVIDVPPLSIAKQGTNNVLNWPDTGLVYTVQTNSDLDSPNWVDDTAPVYNNNSQTNSATDGNLFFRLRFPLQ